MNFKHNKAFLVVNFSLMFVLLSLLSLGIDSETRGQATDVTNATNATASSVGALTVVMPAGSAATTGGGGYEPDPVTASPGSTIIWDNQDNALHTATSGNPETAVLDNMFDTGYVTANQHSNPITMPTEPGEYTYFCTLHPFLTGTVIVQ